MNATAALAWALVALALVPAASPAGAPVAYGKFVAVGVSGVPYADTTNLSFPYSTPIFGTSALTDGQLVYDTQIGFEIVNGEPEPASFLVITEEFTPGTRTVVENVTGPNGTYRLVPVTVPVRLNPRWSNGTVSAQPFSSGEIVLPLEYSGSVVNLSVSVGAANWSLRYLTPATSSIAGVYTAGGIWTFGALMSGVTLVTLLVGLVAARRVALGIGRSPPVPRWWPVLWVAVPVLWFSLGYVSFNQTLGAGSPLLLPAPLVVAAFPYLPRLFTRYWDMAELQGLEALSLEEGSVTKAVLPIVRSQGGLRCAPQTWREALLSHWAGLPEVRGYTVELLGGKVRIQPRFLPVSNPLGPYYRSDATASAWYDARRGLQRPRHRLVWTEIRQEPVFGPDRVTVTGHRPRRRFSPHVEAGYLDGTFPPLRPIAAELAGARAAEVREHDMELQLLENADLRGTLGHLATTYAKDAVLTHEEARQRQDRPRSREELERLLESRRRTRTGPSAEGGEPRGSK